MPVHSRNGATEAKRTEPVVRRVRLRNYKSIGNICQVDLGALTVLVGRNGSGKSNFLDALRFVTDGLQTTLDHAVKSRGGIDAVRRRSTGHPRNLAIELDLDLGSWRTCRYGFELAARSRGKFVVKYERLVIRNGAGERIAGYEVQEGQLGRVWGVEKLPPPADDRLYLVAASGLPDFRPPYDLLTSMGFYNLNPESMKELQSPDSGELLRRDGSNVASVVARLARDEAPAMARLKAYLATIVPGVSDVARESLGPRETLEFRQAVAGAKSPWKFYASSMSDGTLRTLGVLLAVMQVAGPDAPVRLVGIEEPETALHPAAGGALMDALVEASSHTQILVTSHSPDLLDDVDLDTVRLLVVVAREGVTEVAPADEASRSAIRDHLFTPGDLLRMDQLQPDRDDVARQEQLVFFDSNGDHA